jgi:hypothetical protein
MDKVGVKEDFTAITGNEVTTPIGHFNAFPFDRTPRRRTMTIPTG